MPAPWAAQGTGHRHIAPSISLWLPHLTQAKREEKPQNTAFTYSTFKRTFAKGLLTTK